MKYVVYLLNIVLIFPHVFYSLKRVLVGFFIASFIAVSLGLFCGHSKKVGSLLEPLVEILRPIPPIAWIPLAILIFGLGDKSSYFIIFTRNYESLCKL